MKLKKIFSEDTELSPRLTDENTGSDGGLHAPRIWCQMRGYYCRELELLVVDLSTFDRAEQSRDEDLPSSARKVAVARNEAEAIREAIRMADVYIAASRQYALVASENYVTQWVRRNV